MGYFGERQNYLLEKNESKLSERNDSHDCMTNIDFKQYK